MQLFIMRHGQAEEKAPRGGPDSERRLTTEGRQKTRLTGGVLQSLGVRVEVVVTSPYVRARQTAELVAEALEVESPLQESGALAPGGSVRQLVRELRSRENVLVVGHEPDLSRLISLFLWGKPAAAVTMKKGAVCLLDIENLRVGKCAQLEWLLTAKLMSLLR